MEPVPVFERLRRTIERWGGGNVRYDLAPYLETTARIKTRAGELAGLDDGKLLSRARAVRRACGGDPPPERLAAEVFALCAAAARRALELSVFDEQLVGALALHRHEVAEMATGEGKTLVAVFAAAAAAMAGRGVHVLTCNDYLAGRDAAWMRPVYARLGLSVAAVAGGDDDDARRAAYAADVTYLTAREAGFDYLRDNLRGAGLPPVRRPPWFAIVDEADSILVDEARVPLVIAGPVGGDGDATARELVDLAGLARAMQAGRDFDCDLYARTIHPTEEGLTRAEAALGRADLYAEGAPGAALAGRLAHALHAEHLLRRGVDYLVRGGRVELVDEFTGRVAVGRRWPEGLHAAVEAKEGCRPGGGGRVLDTITLQHFLRRYPSLAGMTATARAAASEFGEFYGLSVTVVPPHAPCARRDRPDRVFPGRAAKEDAVVAEILAAHRARRPVLVGTRSVLESTRLAARLAAAGVPSAVLNAERDAEEAAVIARAGMPGAVTVSTNMAGRGVDIRLGAGDPAARAEAAAAGGLYVIGTNRHESARIDGQLRGRAGRQGEPGESRFFISLEDDLFAKYRLRDLLPRRYRDGSFAEHRFVRGEIDRVQRIVEGQHLELKKTLFRYAEPLEEQRALFAGLRESLRAAGDQAGLARLAMAWAAHLADAGDLREGIHLRRIGLEDPVQEFRLETRRLCATRLAGLADAGADAAPDARGDARLPAATWTYHVSDDPFAERPGTRLSSNHDLLAWTAFAWPLLALALWIGKKRGRRNGDSC